MAFRDYANTGRPPLSSVALDEMRRGREAAIALDLVEALKLYESARLRLNESRADGVEAARAHCAVAIEAVRRAELPAPFVPPASKPEPAFKPRKVNPEQARRTAEAMARFQAAHAKWNKAQ